MKKQAGVWVVIAGLIVLILVVSKRSPEEVIVQQKEMTSREAALICTTDMATEYHIHPELTIVINGEKEVLPPDIGLTPTCMNAIHTHDSSGIIHVESPVQKDFTLGDFFAVWQKDFSKDGILDETVDASTQIIVTVNGEVVDTYENTMFRDKDKIVIEYKKK